MIAAAPAAQTFVALPTGVALPYVAEGDPHGTPVVLLHGITDSWPSFAPLMAALPPSLRVVAVSLRGHGDAERPAAGYRPDDFAADVAALLDALGIGRAVLVGHSMGAAVAQRFAIDYPERTSGLMLLGCFYRYGGNPVMEAFAAEIADMTDPIDPAYARDFQVGTLARPVAPGVLENAVAESLKVPIRVWRAALAGLLADGWVPRLGAIQAPTLLGWGEHDAFVPAADQQILLDRIAGARLIVYPGGGHAFHWEEPAPVAADLADFVAALGAERPD